MPGCGALFTFLLLLTMAVTIVNRHSKNILRGGIYPYKNSPHLTKNFFFRYFIIRIVFLFCYELWFRGFLLFDNISKLGILSAIVINVFAYVLLHIFKSKKEIVACIPFGIAACYLSLLFNAAWPAIILHVSISMVYELNIYRAYLVNFLNKTS